MLELHTKHFQRPSPKVDLTTDLAALKDTFELDWNDDASVESILDDGIGEGIERCIAILDDSRFQLFDPVSDRDCLDELVYSAIFGEFIDNATELVNASSESN
jgi:hypothetical protein